MSAVNSLVSHYGGGGSGVGAGGVGGVGVSTTGIHHGNMHSSNLLSNGHSTYPRQAHHLIEQQQQPRLPLIPPVLCSPNEPVSFEFGVHLAEGSKMCSVSNFSSMVELYEKIAQCFDISPKEIGLEDTIYVHRKGDRKEVEVTKTERFLGLTIADNSNGVSYIKKIKEDSTASRVPFIKVGDHIESIMNQSMVGCRHYEVARFLKNIPLNEIFRITLIEPKRSGYISDIIKPSGHHHHQHQLQRNTDAFNCEAVFNSGSNMLGTKNFGTGTIRIRGGLLAGLENTTTTTTTAAAAAAFFDPESAEAASAAAAQMSLALGHINKQLEQFIGINDDELAEELWRLAVAAQQSSHQFILFVADSELNDFKFTDKFLFDVWAVVNDVANGRL
ncbi:PDZ domain-containing protein gipc3 [Tyrophagus putrescentiae]|nr:PDZ domain-containing protein gipc3 [Tyrophagus putrescentiae]